MRTMFYVIIIVYIRLLLAGGSDTVTVNYSLITLRSPPDVNWKLLHMQNICYKNVWRKFWLLYKSFVQALHTVKVGNVRVWLWESIYNVCDVRNDASPKKVTLHRLMMQLHTCLL